MGLLSTEVEVTVTNRNYDYYTEKGYFIFRRIVQGILRPQKNRKLLVNVNDLPITSTIKLEVKCDICGKEYKISYKEYVEHNHDGKIYCRHCAPSLLINEEKNWNWKADKTDEERENGRCYPEYTEFIKKVLARDNYICQCCGNKINKKASVHHLDGYNWCKEKRTDETNGITLCDNCHKNFHSIYGNGNNTKEQYEEWIGHALGKLEKYNKKLPTTRNIFCLNNNTIYNSSQDFANVFNVKIQSVYAACNNRRKCKNQYILWLDEYEEMTEEDINSYKKDCDYINRERRKGVDHPRCRKVICLETFEIFDYRKQAEEKYNTKSIGDCCKGRSYTAGKHPVTGEKLHWMYYDEYNKLSDEDIIKRMSYKNKQKDKQIILLNTLEVFNTYYSILTEYNLSDIHTLQRCCRGKKLSYGTDPITKEPLHWMYYKDYLDNIRDNIDNMSFIKERINEKKVICLNNFIIYDSIADAGRKMKCNSAGISLVCNGKLKTSGVHPETGERLRWMYYKDYLKLSDKETEEFAS